MSAARPREPGRRGLSLRATLLLVGLGVLLYVAAITLTLVAAIAPAADRLGRGRAEIAAVAAAFRRFDEGVGDAAQALHDLLLRSRTEGATPDTILTRPLLARLRELTDGMWTARHLRDLPGAPPEHRAAIARVLDDERTSLALLVEAHAELELGEPAGGLAILRDVERARRRSTDHLDDLLSTVTGTVVEREAELAAVVDALRRDMVIWTVLGVALFLGSAWAVHRRLYRPLGVLRQGLHRVAAGDLDVTLDIQRQDELGYLQQHFNEMTGVLRARASEDQRRTRTLSERLGRVLEQSSDEIYVFDADTLRYLSVNHGAERNLGYSAHELLTRTPVDLLPEFDMAAFRALLEPLRASATERVRVSAVHRRADGTRYPVDLRIQLSQAETPSVFYAIAHDRSEQARLRAERDHIFDLSADLMTVADVRGKVTSVNPAWARTLGLEEPGASQQSLLDLVHADDRALVERQLAELFDGVPVRDTTVRMQQADGAYRWISWNMDLGPGGLCYAVGRDVTEQRRAHERQAVLQAAVERAAREWTVTFDALHDPVVMVDREGAVVRANAAAARLAGVDQRELPGRPLAELSASDLWPHAAALVRQAQESRDPIGAQVQDASGERSWNVQLSPLSSAEAGRGSAIVIAHDVTAVVRLRDAARRNEAMAAVGALVAGVAHEVRNPLFSMTATLDAFEARAGGRSPSPHLTVLRTQLERLQQLMRELLEYGKPPQLVLAATDLRETLRQATQECEPLAAQHDVGLECTAPDGLPSVQGDQPRLVQVFVNLLANAIQHCPRGATVRITACTQHAHGRSWLLTRVEDEGPGFQAQDLTRVFEPFFTRRRGGTGLGLALVQRITEQHGGQVFAANREARGAVVTVYLPYGA